MKTLIVKEIICNCGHKEKLCNIHSVANNSNTAIVDLCENCFNNCGDAIKPEDEIRPYLVNPLATWVFTSYEQMRQWVKFTGEVNLNYEILDFKY